MDGRVAQVKRRQAERMKNDITSILTAMCLSLIEVNRLCTAVDRIQILSSALIGALIAGALIILQLLLSWKPSIKVLALISSSFLIVLLLLVAMRRQLFSDILTFAAINYFVTFVIVGVLRRNAPPTTLPD